MKRILLLLVLLLVLAGGAGGAAWWFLLREPETEEVVEVPVVESAFVEFQPMILPIIERGQIVSQVTMTVVIELPKGENFDRAQMYKPRLRDRIFSELHALYALKYVTDRGYDGEIVRKRLIAVADKIVGPGVLRGIELKQSIYPESS